MTPTSTFIDIILHLDAYLTLVLNQYGVWTYLLIFIIVFCETGLVITPFLPGDSLLFVAGTLAATGALDVRLLFAIMVIAAILGDSINYWIGSVIGTRAFTSEKVRFLRKEHLLSTQAFYEKHGSKTIILARFIPMVRTFAPFVGGIGSMQYGRFLTYNILGAFIWVTVFLLGGYYFGSIPVVKENLAVAIGIIIMLSFIPPIIDYLKHRREKRREQPQVVVKN